MRHSLAKRITLLVAALCVGMGLVAMGAFSMLAQRHVQRSANGDVTTVASMLRSMIRGRGELLRSLTRYVATSPRVRGLVTTDAATVSEQAASLREDIGVDAFLLTDSQGNRLGQAGLDDVGKLDPKDPTIANPLHGTPWNGVVTRGNHLMIAASEPVYVGTLQGTFTTFIELGSRRAHDLRGEAPYELEFVHRGRVTAGSLDLATLPIHETSTPWPVRIRGTEYIAAYAPLPGTNPRDRMGFVVLRPLDETLRPYRQFSAAFLVVLAATALTALIGGSMFGASIARSLDAVVRAAQTLRKGEWPERLPAKRPDEVGLLERTFNDMGEELRRSQERLLAMIDADPLTELQNHRRFKEMLELEAARTTASGQTLAILLLDIDHFARFNEMHGHAAGDAKLKEIAAVLRDTAPEFASVARYSGEQFAVMLPVGTILDAEELYRTITPKVQSVTLSGGCAELASAKGRTEGLVVAAELALAQAKQTGRAKLCDFGAVPGSEEGDPSHLYRTLQDGSYSTVRALAAAVDAKDPYTQGHSDRVARYAADLAAFVGSSEDEVDLVLRCGTLHDIGKIGVPDAILQKTGPLTPEETRLMQAHPVLGELIVRKVPQLHDLLPGVRHHHERYDGKGYPDGLGGEEIPKIARFLALADTYDAMTSDRTYRPGVSPDEALREIERGAGTQFDPVLARAFASMMRTAQASPRPMPSLR